MDPNANGTFFGAPNYNAPADAAPQNGPLAQALTQQVLAQPQLNPGAQQVINQFNGMDPTAGMSGMDKFLAGIGSGMSGGALDAQQALANGNPLGFPPAITDRVNADLAAKAKAKAAVDKALLRTTQGQIGNIAGETAALSPLLLLGR